MNAFYGFKNNINKRISLTKTWFERNEKYLMVVFFTVGFLVDSLTLTRIDQVFDNAILLSYLVLATISIFLLAYFRSLKKINKFIQKIERFLPLITQFAFGALFSGYIIFYTKSATWAVSWFFLLILFVLFVGNEKFKNKYQQIDFQINILFVAVFSFLVFFVPVILKKMGMEIFLLSGVLSILLVYFFVLFLSRYFEKDRVLRRKKIVLQMLGVFLFFNVLYFLNIIPPIPLSMKEIGLYDYVGKDSSGEYVFKEFDFPWYAKLNHLLTIQPNESVYVYSAIFAPTRLNTNVWNVWQKYNEEEKDWQDISRVFYKIEGGRDQGYRGYSFISNVGVGKYRVDIQTKEGLVVGRIKFKVI